MYFADDTCSWNGDPRVTWWCQVANYASLACLVSGQPPHDLQMADGQRDTTRPWYHVSEYSCGAFSRIRLVCYCFYLRFTQNSLIEKEDKMNSLSCVAGWSNPGDIDLAGARNTRRKTRTSTLNWPCRWRPRSLSAALPLGVWGKMLEVQLARNLT